MSMPTGGSRKVVVATLERPGEAVRCCPHFHDAVELIGKRWTGAILFVLVASEQSLRFSEVAQAVPQLSDRMLSERMKELESRGVVERRVSPEPPGRVEYALTDMGRELAPTLRALETWAQRWIAG
jgi:DNA-binding HxlR family transcriptional regulator